MTLPCEGRGSPVTPLRILTESNALEPLGGIELSTLQDSIALSTRGHQVHVIYGADGALRLNYQEAAIGLRGPITLSFDPRRPIDGITRSISPARWAREREFDVLWLQRFEHMVLAQAISRWSSTPIVCHLHHQPRSTHTSLLSRGVAHFIATSHFMRDQWIEAGIHGDRISVIHNALPTGEYPPGGKAELVAARERLGIPVDVGVVLCYGTMIPEKGIGTLLDAWGELGMESDRAVLVLVGSPSPVDDPELAAKFHRFESCSVRWFPMQVDVVPFLHAADLVVFPSWLPEGFGRVVIEGMATGRPVIASRVGAVPEILFGPMERFIVEARDPIGLAERIRSLLDWRETNPSLGLECTDLVNENFPHDDHVVAVEDVLLQHRRQP
jgi:glycosyltransferase involved in cell wall biosynthesis